MYDNKDKWLESQVRKEKFEEDLGLKDDFTIEVRDGKAYKISKNKGSDHEKKFTKDVIKYKDEEQRNLDEKIKTFDKFGLNDDSVDIKGLF